MEISQQEEQRYVELQLLALNFAREGNIKELENMLKEQLYMIRMAQKIIKMQI